jgi:hypothetical protein
MRGACVGGGQAKPASGPNDSGSALAGRVGALLRAVPGRGPGRHASLGPPWLTYAVILLANGMAAAQRIAITQNASPPSDA